MKKYKIGNRIVTADSMIEAVKIVKMLDSPTTKVKAKDADVRETARYLWTWLDPHEIRFNSSQELQSFYSSLKRAISDMLEDGYRKHVEMLKKRGLDSANDVTIDELTKEEQQAVEDYREAIRNTSNPKLLKIYSHILEEETEHLQELAQAKEVADSPMTYRGVSYEKKNGFWVIKHKGEEWAYPDSWSEDRVKYEIDYELDGIEDCSSKIR